MSGSAGRFAEFVVEDAALAWLGSLGWQVARGSDIAPGELPAERGDYGQVVLEQRLRQALPHLNPTLPAEALDDAFRNAHTPGRPQPRIPKPRVP